VSYSVKHRNVATGEFYLFNKFGLPLRRNRKSHAFEYKVLIRIGLFGPMKVK